MANGLRKRGDTREAAEKSAFDAVYASFYGTEMGSGRKQKGLSVLDKPGQIVLVAS